MKLMKAWLGRLWRRRSSKAVPPPVYPRLYETRLEARHLLDGVPLVQWDPAGGLTLSAGAQAQDGIADTFRLDYVEQDGHQQFRAQVNGTTVFERPVEEVAGLKIHVLGSSDADLLQLDWRALPGGSVEFIGHGSGSQTDTLVVESTPSPAAQVQYQLAGDEGLVTIRGAHGPASQIHFQGVEFVQDGLLAHQRAYLFRGLGDEVRLSEVTGSAAVSQLQTGTGLTLHFQHPLASLSLDLREDAGAASSPSESSRAWERDSLHIGDWRPGAVQVELSGDDADLIRLESGSLVEAQGAWRMSAGTIELDGVLRGGASPLQLTAAHELTVSATAEIVAPGGNVRLQAPDLQHAGRLDVQTGQATLDATPAGQLLVHGTVSARGESAGQTGGTIHLLGQQVRLADGGRLDASGLAGGGTVRIGGDLYGETTHLPAARWTIVERNTRVAADAIEAGDGGSLVVWADEQALVSGSGNLSARGGRTGGDGGLIETSGRQYLWVEGAADASAPRGAAGTWLLDPRNVTIANNENQGLAGGELVPLADNTQIRASTIEAALAAGTNVTIYTGESGTQAGNIVVNSRIEPDMNNNSAVLSLIAAGDITISELIRNDRDAGDTGLLHVVLAANQTVLGKNDDLNPLSGNVTVNRDILTLGGSFTSSGVNFSNPTGAIETAGGNIQLNHTGNITIGDVLKTTSGAVTLTGLGNVTVNSDITTVGGSFASSGVNFSNPTGAIGTARGNIQLTHTGNITLGDVLETTSGAITVSGLGTVTLNNDILTSTATGTLDVNSGVETVVGAGGSIDTGGAVSFGAASTGGVSLRSTILTDDASVTFYRSVTLTADALVDTGPGGGNILFLSTIASGGHDLTLDAGTGSITLAGDLTGGGILTVTSGGTQAYQGLTLSELDVTGDSLSFLGAASVSGPVTLTAANSIHWTAPLTTTGSGTVVMDSDGSLTIQGAVNARGAVALTADSSLNLFAPLSTTNNGTVTLTSAAGLTTILGAGDITADGAVVIDSIVSTSGDIDTTNDAVTFKKAVTLIGNTDVDTGAGGGAIRFESTVESGGNGLALAAGTGNVTLLGSFTGGGSLTVRSGAVQSYAAISTGALTIQAAQTSVTFNGSINTFANVSVTSGGTLVLNSPLTTSNGGQVAFTATGSVTLNGALTASGNVAVTSGSTISANASLTTSSGGQVSFDATGTTTLAAAADIRADGAVSFGATRTGALTTAADISTTGDDVTFGRAVTLSGNVDIDTYDEAAPPLTSGNISFNSTLNAANRNLSLDAGPGGNVTLAGALTNGGQFTVRHGATQSYQALTATRLTIQNAATAVTFNGNLNISGNVDVDSSGTITLNAPLTTSSGGDVSLDALGLTTLAAAGDILAAGDIAFGVDKAGELVTAADIRSTSGDVRFARPVRLSGNIRVDANGAGDIVFDDSVSSNSALLRPTLILNAGTGEAVVAGNVNAVALSPLGLFRIEAASTATVGSITVAGTAFTDTIDITATTIELQGRLATDGAGLDANTGGIRLNGSVRLTGNTELDTSDGGTGTDGRILLVQNSVRSSPAGQFGISFDTGTRSLDLSNTNLVDLNYLRLVVTTTAELENVLVADGSANPFTPGAGIDIAIAAGGVLTVTGSLRTTAFDGSGNGGAIQILGPGTLQAASDLLLDTDVSPPFTDGAVTLTAAILGQGGTDRNLILAAGDGTVTTAGAIGTSVGTASSIGDVWITGGAVAINGSINADGTIQITGSTSVITGALGVLDSRGEDITLRTNSLILGAAVQSTGGGDQVLISGLTGATSIGVGESPLGQLQIPEATLIQIQSSFENTVLGIGAGQTGTITLDDGLILAGDLFVTNTGLILDADPVAGVVNLDTEVKLFDPGGNFVVRAPNVNVFGAALVRTTDADIRFDGDLTLGEAATLRLETTNGADLLVDGDVTIHGSLRSNGGGNEHLTVNAGLGAIQLGASSLDQIGDPLNRLGELQLTAAGDITIYPDVFATSLFVANGGGTTTFFSSLHLNGSSSAAPGDALEITAGTVYFSPNTSLTVAAGGGQIDLNGTVILQGTLTVTTQGSGVDLAGAELSSTTAGSDLIVNTTDGGAGLDGSIVFGSSGALGGERLARIQLTANDGLGPAGDLFFRNDLYPFVVVEVTDGFQFSGDNVVVGQNTTLLTEGTDIRLDARRIDAAASGLTLLLDARGGGVVNGGDVTLATIGPDGTGGGAYLAGLVIRTDGTGTIHLDHAILLDAPAANLGGLTLEGNVEIGGNVSVFTEALGDNSSAPIDLSDANLFADVPGRSLFLITAATPDFHAGNILLAEVGDNFGGSAFLQQLVINASNNGGLGTAGSLRLTGDVQLDDAGGAAGSFFFSGRGVEVSSPSDLPLTIDTEFGGDAPGGHISLGNAYLSSLGSGASLLLDARGNGAGGVITFGSVGDQAGHFLARFAALTEAPGEIRPGGDILTDGSAGPLAPGVELSGVVRLSVSTVIRTEQNSSGRAGEIDLQSATVAANFADVDLTLDASTADPGEPGGLIQLGRMEAVGGLTPLRHLTISAGGAPAGDLAVGSAVTISGTLTVSDVGTIQGAGHITAAAVRLTADQDIGDLGQPLQLTSTDITADVLDSGSVVLVNDASGLVFVNSLTAQKQGVVQFVQTGDGIPVILAADSDSHLDFISNTGSIYVLGPVVSHKASGVAQGNITFSTQGNLILYDTAIVETERTAGKIKGTAAGIVHSFYGAQIRAGTENPATQAVVSALPPIINLLQPTEARPNVNVASDGRASFLINLGLPGGWVNEQNFLITVDWGDGTLKYPPNASESKATRFDSGITYEIAHTYLDNPNPDPAANIPIVITVAPDPRGRIEFFEGGETTNVLATVIPLELTVPAGGFGIPIVLPPLEGPRTVLVTAAVRETAPAPTSFTPQTSSNILLSSGTGASATGGVRHYVLRVVTPVSETGEVRESEDISLPDDVLEDLAALFRQLDDDRYRIYQILEDGTQMLVKDVTVRDRKAIEVETEETPWEELATEAAEAPEADPPALDPPALDPPALDPPALDPPALEQPALDPPAFNPPEQPEAGRAAEPPATVDPGAWLPAGGRYAGVAAGMAAALVSSRQAAGPDPRAARGENGDRSWSRAVRRWRKCS